MVIPTFNERDSAPKLVEALLGLHPGLHVLVVDDNSPDGTAAAVAELQRVYPTLMLLKRTQNKGFAPSYRDGFRRVLEESWCQAVITMDADFSHNPASVAPLLDKLSIADVGIGSRYTHGGSVANWNFRRRMLSRAANFYVRASLGLPVRDATAGFMCMSRSAMESVPVQETVSEGYAFLVELKYMLSRAGNRMAELPITFEERREGQSKMSMGKVWESFWMPWRIRRHALRDRIRQRVR
ncbi:MAG: polyprenol monophosphomannose synthase [Acidobacteriota bacterium]